MAFFDPNAAAQPGSGVFGLPHDEATARVVLLPVPFDATTSYRRGTAGGPTAIREASRQVDLFDREVGRVYEAGIFMPADPSEVRAWNEEARAAADPIIEVGGVMHGNPALAEKLAHVNALSEAVNEWVYRETSHRIAAGKLVGTIGGDHATPFGAIRAHAEAFGPLGILHLDAHADLRPAYEGFTYSHASIMYNVHRLVPEVERIVHVGIRDFSEEESRIIDASNGKLIAHFDADRARASLEGEPFARFAERAIASLPERVYVSYDIDGLDPALCPNTGTPVPGGLSFHEANYLLFAIVRSGRRIVGFDLNEVAPGPEGNEWDANVAARLLYKMIGWALLSEQSSTQ